MELEDLMAYLKKKSTDSESPPIIVNIDLGDVLSRIIDRNDRVKTRESYAPYPS